MKYSAGSNNLVSVGLEFNGTFPWLTTGGKSASGRYLAHDIEGNCPEGVPELWMNLTVEGSGYYKDYVKVVIEHENSSDTLEFEYVNKSVQFVNIVAANIGNNEYVYAMSVPCVVNYDPRPVGVVFRVKGGKFEILAVFDDSDASRDVESVVDATFSSNTKLSGTMYPTGTKFTVNYSKSASGRSGKTIYRERFGNINLWKNDEGYYDLIFSPTYYYASGKSAGDLVTYYTMKGGELKAVKQTFEHVYGETTYD